MVQFFVISKIISTFAAQKAENNNIKIEYQNEKNISAAQPPPREQTRFPRENGNKEWSSRT